MKHPLILVLASFLTFSACGSGDGKVTNTPPLPNPGVVTSENLREYVEMFEQDYGVDVNYSVVFDNDGTTGGSTSLGTTVGVCQKWSDGRRKVLINSSWWASQASSSRKVLIYHELGHCSFNRDHDNSVDTSVSPNRPLSMMYPVINPIVYYYIRGYENYYLNELYDNRVSSMTDDEFLTQSSQASFQEIHDHDQEADNGNCVELMD